MLRMALVVVAFLLVGCFGAGSCKVVGPSGASSSFSFAERTTESELRAFLENDGWTVIPRSAGQQGIFVAATRIVESHPLNASVGVYDDGTWFLLTADDANVSSDEQARDALARHVQAFQTRAPRAWGQARDATYSGGAKLCVD